MRVTDSPLSKHVSAVVGPPLAACVDVAAGAALVTPQSVQVAVAHAGAPHVPPELVGPGYPPLLPKPTPSSPVRPGYAVLQYPPWSPSDSTYPLCPYRPTTPCSMGRITAARPPRGRGCTSKHGDHNRQGPGEKAGPEAPGELCCNFIIASGAAGTRAASCNFVITSACAHDRPGLLLSSCTSTPECPPTRQLPRTSAAG